MQIASLRLKLILRLLPAMLAIVLLGAATAYWVASRIATKAYDHALLDTALGISEQLHTLDGRVRLTLTEQARKMLLTDQIDSIHYAIYDAQGLLIDGAADLPVPRTGGWLQKPAGEGWFYDGVFDGRPVRLAGLSVTVDDRRVAVLVAETILKRREATRDILLGILVPEWLLVLVSASVIWFGVRSGLRPLDDLSRQLASRSQADLSPVRAAVPDELSPLLTEINSLLARLGHALNSQRHFVSDAAHQLRTPIAALLAQVEAARHELGEAARPALSGIHAAAGRLGHLVDQLLALARAEPGLAQGVAAVQLIDLIREVAERWLPTAIGKDIELDFALSPVAVEGNELLLQEMLGNLLDNALRLTPRGGSVTVGCGGEGGAVWLGVEDSGPGIPADERGRIGERFYRPAGQQGEGCGLGLAIVREIARQHGGWLEIGESAGLGGARFRVVLPAPPAAEGAAQRS